MKTLTLLRQAAVVVLGVVAANLAFVPSGQAEELLTLDNLYTGLSGQQFVFSASGYSNVTQSAITDTIFAEYEKRTGATVILENFCCGIGKLEAMHSSDNVTWTLVVLATVGDLLQAEKNELLLKLDRSIVPLDQLEDGTYSDYAIHVDPFAAVVTWNTDKWPLTGKHPKSIEDVFNTEDFPGKRCLYKYPQFGGVLESAALADGVAPENLYPLDLKRAFKQLDKIRDDIVWWNTAAQGIQQLRSGACDIGLNWNGPLADTLRESGGPLAVAWGNAIWEAGAVAIPKGAKNPKAALGILRLMVTERQAQEEFTRRTSYLLTALKDPVPIAEEVKPWVLAGANKESAIQENAAYYAENIDTILKMFNEWVVSGSPE